MAFGQKLKINAAYMNYSDSYDIDLIDRFSLTIRGRMDIDSVDERVVTKINDMPLNGTYYVSTENAYELIYNAKLKIKLHRKYHSKDCIITYKYKFGAVYSVDIGENLTLSITDGKNHPKVQLCGKNAENHMITNLTYIGKGSRWRNFKRNIRGIFLPNYIGYRKISV